MLRHFQSILLLVSFLALGTGGLGRLHQHAHELQDLARAEAHHSHERDSTPVHHDESNCDWHVLLRAPLASLGWVPLLISLGLLVAFLTQLRTVLLPQGAQRRVDCRGPPER